MTKKFTLNGYKFGHVSGDLIPTRLKTYDTIKEAKAAQSSVKKITPNPRYYNDFYFEVEGIRIEKGETWITKEY